jgi:cyclase
MILKNTTMLKKRIVPCLDIKNGRTVKGVNFVGLKDAGDPIELAKRYMQEGADELVFLDITATNEQRQTVVDLAAAVAKQVAIPFTVGGGVDSVELFRKILYAGADKVAMNSAAIKNPQLIEQCADAFGAQAVVVAIDAKSVSSEQVDDNLISDQQIDGQSHKKWEVFIGGGRVATGLDAIEWAKQAEALGAGEILLTSMDRDGTKIGFDLELTNAICNAVSVPVIASGGVGKPKDFLDVFQTTKATAALAASVFHYGEIPVPVLKQYLAKEGVPVRI